jgi:hypothetical protein
MHRLNKASTICLLASQPQPRQPSRAFFVRRLAFEFVLGFQQGETHCLSCAEQVETVPSLISQVAGVLAVVPATTKSKIAARACIRPPISDKFVPTLLLAPNPIFYPNLNLEAPMSTSREKRSGDSGQRLGATSYLVLFNCTLFSVNEETLNTRKAGTAGNRAR